MTIVLLSVLAPTSARAEIRDDAEFFTAQAERQAAELIQQIRQRHGADVIVETVPSLRDAPTRDPQRQDFFESEVERRGKEAGLTGIYILATAKPRYLYAGVDPATQKRSFTLEDRSQLRDALIARFQNEDFDRGLLEGLRMVDQTMASNAASGGGAGAGAKAGAAGGAPGAARDGGATGGATDGDPRSSSPGGDCGFGGIGGLLCLVIAGLAVFTIIRGLMRRRQAAGGGSGAPGYGQPGVGQTGMGQPGMGQPGYDPRYPQQQGGMMGGGGGMGRGILGGLLGGVAGGYLYDKMSGPGGGNEAQAAPPPDPGTTPLESPDTSGGGSFEPTDLGGGGDFGGGDGGGGGEF